MSENIVTEALVNKKTGEVVEIGLQKSPDEIMLDARNAARALENLIESNKRKPVEFGGKRYLEYPHWQTIAKFYHTTAATGRAEFVEMGELKGFKARGEIFDEKTGSIVGYAEAYCMTDEPNWKHKPLFQLASMAQTRAACKALSNKYRYVAIVAGYEPTPAEEADMSAERNLRAPQEKPQEIEMGSPPPLVAADGIQTISDKQRKMLFARWKKAEIPDEMARVYMKEHFGKEHSGDLTWSELDKMLKWIEGYQTGN